MQATPGGYQLLQRIAIGGMAEVFLARRPGATGCGQLVALKRILPHLARQPDFVAMFLDEARLLAPISHPHIVQTLDFGAADGSYFLAMEYVCGEDVHALLRVTRQAGERVPLATAVTILIAAAEALHHAHEQGIVHRDVTPANLLVGYDGVVKLADFGIAKSQALAARVRTTAGTLKGKVPYMSPEQARALPCDRRSDIFSLGVLAWELLTGERLFERANELELLCAVQRCDVPPLDGRGHVPPLLTAAIARALAPLPEARWATAAELARALAAGLASVGEAPSAARVRATMARRFGKNAAARKLGRACAPVEATGVMALPGARPEPRLSSLHLERWIPQIAMHLHLPPRRARLLVPLLALVVSAGGLLFGLRSQHAQRVLAGGVVAPAPPAARPQASPLTAPAKSDAVASRDRARPHPHRRTARAKPRRPSPDGV